jgi:exodeoxyribonuclease V beta subunit
MTVHKAKGLQWPVVFAPYLWCVPGHLVVSMSDGRVGRTRPVEVGGREGSRCLDYRALVPSERALGADADQRAETLRQTYVALTRASERSYVAWGPLGRLRDSLPRSGLSLIAGCALAGIGGQEVHAQAQATKAWFEVDQGLVQAVEALQGFPGGAKKKDLLAALGIDEKGWARVQPRLVPGGWATCPKSGTYVPTGNLPVLPGAGSFATHLGSPAAPAAMTVEALPAPAPRLAAGQVPVLAPLPTAQPPGSAWIVTSFTGLTRGHAEITLTGALGDEAGRGAGAATVEATGIHAFPAGAGPGDCLHRIIERADLRDPGGAANCDLVEGLLRNDGLGQRTGQRDAYVAAVLAMLGRLATSVIPGTETPLGRLEAAARRHEWPFDLHLGSRSAVRLGMLAEVVQQHPDEVLDEAWAATLRNLGHRPVDGWLTGKADLVARLGERWWVIDWKSNRLGPEAGVYGRDRLLADARGHLYPLQWMIYLVALHRQLAARLTGYDPERHLGGAAYAYLRGLSDTDPGAGWLVHRPSAAAVARWSAVLSPEAVS